MLEHRLQNKSDNPIHETAASRKVFRAGSKKVQKKNNEGL